LANIRETTAYRFGLLRDMNDPQESQVVLPQFHVQATPPEPAILTTEENEQWLARDWVTEVNVERGRAKVGSFVMDAEPDLSRLGDDEALRRVLESPAQFAARGFAHPRMWAQYADQHKGVCIVFDLDQMRNAVQKAVDGRFAWGWGPVRYALPEYGPHLGSFDVKRLIYDGVRKELISNYETVFLEKHPDWSQEGEFRFIVIDGTDQPFYVPLHGSCVAGLVLGPLCDERDHRDDILAFARMFELPSVRKAFWPEGRCEVPPAFPPGLGQFS
jgi:hypothetical protein